MVSEQSDPEETIADIARMAKKKMQVTPAQQLQGVEEQVQLLGQRSKEFMKEVYGHLDMHTKQLQQNHNS